MKAYGRNLRWIEDHQYGDEMHTGIPLPSSGKRRGQRRRRYKRPFKKSERQHSRHMIRRELAGISRHKLHNSRRGYLYSLCP